ncbi:ATP-dependent DNA helicase sgs1 [Cadophora gregata]|uniref:ATP-dependent DNA helicase sgs1 n=1 Tax=Cadophora gregata TaxID=51156 RepID=UPI0026DAA38C|nr:ATP-dependent DNA helicase sgs1 [Cadophora gregata]KAK0118944.1 ATP-dependent DNA helicase sgs1 [Cadophora gregata f. sp. sojae]KAK0126198.1 ATP-dependent DNA helicase sgs1 [Cadophora gregata]
MTRHNLESHISWLLSRKVKPASGVNAGVQTYSTGHESVNANAVEEEADLDIPRAAPSPPQHQRPAHVVNVVETFARPALPASVTAKSHLQDSRQVSTNESMGRLSSTTRPSRPSLMSQHQLATPASTTSSTAASCTSLSSSYMNLLKGQDSPTSRQSASRSLPPKIQKSLQTQTHTPRTPRQTPRPKPGSRLDTIDSVDLTNDEDGGNRAPGSSSSVEVFGDPIRLWREDSASRAEPLPRSSRKRKSLEMSPRRSKRTDSYERQYVKTVRGQYSNANDFVDIDDVLPSQSTRPLFQPSCSKAAKPSVDSLMEQNDIEEVQVTETISRIETRTRKSASRVSSTVDDPSTRPQLGDSSYLPTSAQASPVMSPLAKVQVAASPLRRVKSPTLSSPHTPHKTPKRRTRTIIRDSEDDEYSDVEKRISSSPRIAIKNSPRLTGSQANSKMERVPASEQNDPRLRDYKNVKPRTGSPLRPISRNLSVRSENRQSPFQRDSPTKVAFAKHVPPPSDQQMPRSSLGVDDRKLVMFYLTRPSAIDLYHQRVQNLLAQNAIASMSFVDKGDVAPMQLKSERIALLDMGKAYSSLAELQAGWQILMHEKKKLAKQVYELLERNADTSHQEERQASVNQEIKRTELDVARFLHESGAIRDGFGTESNQEASTQSGEAKRKANIGPLPSGSSTIGSAQIIMQTQFPSIQLSSTATSNPHFPKEMPTQSTLGLHSAISSNVCLPPPSPSPTRQSVQYTSLAESQPTNFKKVWPSPEKVKQPNFYQETPPFNFDDFNDDELDEFLADEPEHDGHVRAQEEVPYGIEDDYGDSEDDNDFVEMAQEVEKRQSLPSTLPKQSRYTVLSEPAPTMSSKPSSTADGKTMYSHVDEDQSNMFDHPWSEEVKKVLRERFKLKGFRRHQLDAINATLSGQDAFVLMPTGGGKSLCYQLPAVVKTGTTCGVTIVISPLLSLMNDQVQHLRAVNVQAATLNSDTPDPDKRQIYNFLREERPEHYIQLLYITPELINKSTAMINALTRLYKKRKLARFVIDEAHCVSQWGHDFRPDYVALGNVRTQFPKVPLMALTATATGNVKLDIMENLKMRKCPIFVQSFNRPNLHYEVRLKKGKGVMSKMVIEIADLVKNKYKKQTGIIYALSQRGCEELAEKLVKEHQIRAHHFHAGMTREEKSSVLDEWQTGKIQVVVATIAFGMGIDKPDVRFVVHSSVPKSLEGYYQETGRAGRDGKKSGCYLYFGYQDVSMLKGFIDKSEGSEEQKQRQRSMLQQMIQYCENRSDCRRSQVLAYFGEKFVKKDCHRTCDNCCSDAVFDIVDFTDYAKAAMRVVKQVQLYSFTMLNCVEVLRGTGGANAKLRRMEGSIAEFGVASKVARSEIERLFYRLLLERAIMEDSVMNKSGFASDYVKLGPNCRDYMTGKQKIYLTVEVPGSSLANQKSQGVPKYPTSTMLTSPISAAAWKSKANNPASKGAGYERDDFVVSDDESDTEEDAFESMKGTRCQALNTPVNSFASPITIDQRMAGLHEIHRAVVHEFVPKAKSLEEKLRNKAGARRAFFTESNFRDMAISFTTTLDAMRQIPGINVERVDTYGKHFTSLIKQFQTGYEEAMGGAKQQDQDEDMDTNHQNVIDLVTDDEGVDDEDQGIDEEDDDFEVDEETEAAMQLAERSRYFEESSNGPFSRNGSTNSASTGQSRAGSTYRGRGKSRGGKRYKPRTSTGSASGQSTSGVRKKSWPGQRKSRARKTSGLKFAQQSGRAGGSGGMSIGMMPT